MTVKVSDLRKMLEAARHEADEKAAAARAAGNTEGALFAAGKVVGLTQALAKLTLAEAAEARARDAELAANILDEEIGEEAVRLGVIGYGASVNRRAVEELEEFARNAGGAVDMASGQVYSDADGGL